MRGRLSHSRHLYLLLFLGFGLAAGGSLNAADGTARAAQPIEISAPKSQTLVTNVNQLGTEARPESAPAGEFSVPEIFSPANSLGGLMPLPPPTRAAPAPSRRTREWLDQRRNWAFQTPEDAIRDIAMRDFLNLPSAGSDDGQETQPSSSVERFYDRTWREREGTDAQKKNDPFGSKRAIEEKKKSDAASDSKRLANFFDHPQQPLKNLLSSDLNEEFSEQDAGANRLLEAFGLGTVDDDRDNELSPRRIAEKNREKEQFRQFRDILNGTSSLEDAVLQKSSPVANPWSAGGAVLAPATPSMNPFATLPGATPNPALAPPVNPLLPVPSSLAPIPYAAAPERTPPPRPTFSYPQRAF